MEFPKRKLPRLRGFDYSSDNYYFVTICTHEKRCLFGSIQMPSVYARMAEEELLNIPKHYERVRIDKYVVMPNHVHAIIVLGCQTNTERSRPLPTLSTVLGLYKAGVSRKIHEISPDIKVWQKSFYDTIIRNEEAYQSMWKYIDENPLKWEEDELYM